MNKTTNLQSILGILIATLFIFFGVQKADAAITRQLDLGSSGSDVVELQTYFAMDKSIYPLISITGYFDSFTQSATQRFQDAQGIVSKGTPKTTGYGRVGPKTIIKLNALLFVKNAVVLLKQEQADPGLPMRLEIPEINVDATFEYMGMTLDGAMDMTKNLDSVVWFDLGPRPGDNGSAVIAGHYDGRGNGESSIFDNLHKLRPGDKIYIEDNKGAVISFVVRESRRYDPKADASDIFDSNDGKSHLNLITCDGVWDKVSETYSQRLVIFTDKE